MITGFTSGCFDLIHYGHLKYLQRCKELCNTLIVGIDSDKLVREFKGPLRPIIPALERLSLVKSLSMVDKAFIVYELSSLTNICQDFRVDKVFKHEGYKQMDFIYGVDDTSAELVIVPDIPGLRSTTWIINQIKTK